MSIKTWLRQDFNYDQSCDWTPVALWALPVFCRFELFFEKIQIFDQSCDWTPVALWAPPVFCRFELFFEKIQIFDQSCAWTPVALWAPPVFRDLFKTLSGLRSYRVCPRINGIYW